ncbi:PorP/SprF family type IX secretion system membrane protein [Sphingobacterium sp. SYP-B4668]|uniref:PorP/SprF family type IX secretion system membrane protein n=1 Tax=Sphingobacterium sp. SYP-B4668 TaxID=2996035 RepID=UPI0022DE4010|nr:PorP/SprF family type IX secretion system membrane protein [Sphingobacterium sp. SYP-B4668]
MKITTKISICRYRIMAIMAIIMLLSNVRVSGQQYIDPALSGSFSKMLNPSFNALLNGGEGDAALVYRYQWAGLDGAPKSIWFNGNLGIGQRGIAVGINAKQFRIGVERSTEVSANFTKTLQISDQEYVGLGLNLGYTQQRGDFTSLAPEDPAFQNVQYGTLLYGLSASLVRPDKYYVGLSMPRAIFGSNDSDYVRQFGRDNTFYVSTGMLFDLGSNFHLRPNLLASYREVTGLQFDGSATLFISPKVGIGAGYRQRGDLMGIAEFNIGKLRFAYSYQQNLKNKDLNRYITNSSHELGLSFKFGSRGFSML